MAVKGKLFYLLVKNFLGSSPSIAVQTNCLPEKGGEFFRTN